MPVWVAFTPAESNALTADDRVLTDSGFNNFTVRRHGVCWSGFLYADEFVAASKTARRNY